MELLQIWQANSQCQRCSLRKECNQVVCGIGPANTKLMLVGEAPGADEDIEGVPFVGQSGELLNKFLQAAGISREGVYITNAVKCRPKNNTVPDATTIAACKRWLWEELKLIQPQVVVPLGKVAAALLLKLKNFTMKSILGKTYKVEYIKAVILPWYHPSYLLRQGSGLDEDTVIFFKKIKELLSSA